MTGTDGKRRAATIIPGETLRALRRSRGWDVPALAREMRKAAGNDWLPSHDSLLRMIHRWEREGLNTSSRAQRYELLYASIFGVSPEDLIGGLFASQAINSGGWPADSKDDNPTLLRVLLRQRHWTKFEAFEAQFMRAARELARRDEEPRLARISVSKRTYERWGSGKVGTMPLADASRVLEFMFGFPVRELLRAPEPADSEGIAVESGSSTPVFTFDKPRNTTASKELESERKLSPPENLWRIPRFADARDIFTFGFTPDDEERIIHAARRPSRVDSRIVGPLTMILAAQRETEDAIGSAPLIEPVSGQLDTIENFVVEARGATRPMILDIAAQWAEYAGWLNISVGNSRDARMWLDRAYEWATEADNPTLASTVLSFKGHMAFLLGQIAPMISLTHAAQRSPSAWVGQRAYDSYQEARGLAISGDFKSAVKATEKGTELALLANEQDATERPPWIYYYTPTFFALERGIVHRFLGRDSTAHNDEAIRSLNSALKDLGDVSTSDWAAEYIYHLAYAYMQAGAPDAACQYSMDVLRIAEITESPRLAERIRGIHVRLEKQWPVNPEVNGLGMALQAAGK